MNLPLGFGDVEWDDWIRGIVAAFIGGGASAFSAGVADLLNHPGVSIWNREFWSVVSTTFVIAGLIALFAFLRTKPIPDKKVVTTTVQKTQVDAPNVPDKVVTTVQETHTEPIAKEEK